MISSTAQMGKLRPTEEVCFFQGHRERETHAEPAVPGVASPTSLPPAPHLSWGSTGGFSEIWGISGEDTGSGLGALWMTLSSTLLLALEKPGSSHEGFQSANSRGRR